MSDQLQAPGTKRRVSALILTGVVFAATVLAATVLAGAGLNGPSPIARAAAQATAAPETQAPTSSAQRVQRTLRVTAFPSNASVSVREAATTGPTPASKSPARFTVTSAAVTVSVAAPGYQTRFVDVALQAASTEVFVRLDPEGQLHRSWYESTTGSNPKQVAFTPDGKELWVPLLGSRGVDVFDAATGRKLTTVALGKHGAVEVVFNRDGTRAYVSQMETASVYEVDTKTRKVLRNIVTGGNWTKVLLLSPDENTLYAANWVSNDISVLDLRTGKAVKQIRTVKTPRGLALDAEGKRLFVAGFDGGEIVRITLATGETSTLVRTGGAMRHCVVDPVKNRLYADDMATAQVFVVDLTTEKVRELAKTDSHPNTIDLSPDGRFLYVSNRGENSVHGYNVPGPEWGSVTVFDTETGALVDALVGGNQTTGLDVSPDGAALAYTDFLDNRLVVSRIPGAQVLADGKGGLAPKRRALIVKRAKS